MVHIHSRQVVGVPVDLAFEYTADFRNAATWVFGVTQLEVVGDRQAGLGTVYRGSIKLGPTVLSSEVEIVGWETNARLITKSIAGFVNSCTWQFRGMGDHETELVVDVDYELPGGIAGRALGRIIEPFVSIAVHQSEKALVRILNERYKDVACP